MPNETTSCLKHHLKIVELFHVRDDKHEFDLVKFFLKNGHILQKMRISLVHGDRNTDEIITEIMRFPRSSPNLALTFVEPFHISLDDVEPWTNPTANPLSRIGRTNGGVDVNAPVIEAFREYYDARYLQKGRFGDDIP
ncbi:hypothetical protein LWI29_011764 [Acer saccharum]|uniref:FBD domain-containing protein n=1 Tax=Acer saccharum TaxID=4024 RepID=A0AA39SZ97_ACESA|nr:hypothetical protein LWI29_011764 [Acer saccharum]